MLGQAQPSEFHSRSFREKRRFFSLNRRCKDCDLCTLRKRGERKRKGAECGSPSVQRDNRSPGGFFGERNTQGKASASSKCSGRVSDSLKGVFLRAFPALLPSCLSKLHSHTNRFLFLYNSQSLSDSGYTFRLSGHFEVKPLRLLCPGFV